MVYHNDMHAMAKICCTDYNTLQEFWMTRSSTIVKLDLLPQSCPDFML